MVKRKTLTEYDLPDLTASLAPRKLVLAGLKDQMKKPRIGKTHRAGTRISSGSLFFRTCAGKLESPFI
jgi:hypothetical protein